MAKIYLEGKEAPFPGSPLRHLYLRFDIDGDGSADLLLWVDSNQNAITDDGELQTLSELGVFELSLASEDPDFGADNPGVTSDNEITNLVSGVSTFRGERTADDGSLILTSGLLADVSIVYESVVMQQVARC